MPDSSRVQLLDSEGAITDKAEACLKHIFAKYCTPAPSGSGSELLSPPSDAYLSPEGLDRWAIDTNGEAFSEETKEEVTESFDTTDEGNLTFRGFLELYQLQTENDEKETWRDLQKHGFDDQLELKSR